MRRWWRRERPAMQVEQAGGPAEGNAGLPAVRVERALVALAVHAQQIEDRLGRLEQRVAEHDERASVPLPTPVDIDAATHDELLEVRIHSAKVAAELARLSVSLRARIDDVAVRIPPAPPETSRRQRAQVLAESILDLSDRIEPAPLDLRDEHHRRTA